MKYDYGFIYKAKGEDGEGLDVYLGTNQEPEKVYIVHQNDPKTGKYDEDKVMLGFDSSKKAKSAYLAHYDNPKFFGSMSEIDFVDFKDLILSGKGRVFVNWKKKAKKVK